MQSWKKVGMACALLVAAVLPCAAQQDHPDIHSYVARGLRQGDSVSSYCAKAQYAMRYTDVINCRNAEEVIFLVTVAGCGATSVASCQIEWLPDTFGGAQSLISGLNGYPVVSGWNYEDTSTSTTKTAAESFSVRSVTKMPFCRLGFRQAKADDGDVKFTITWYLRYKDAREYLRGAVGNTQLRYQELVRLNATVAAGATSANLTLPRDYTPTRYQLLSVVLSPAVASDPYAGHGYPWFTWTGGTSAEVGVSSKTFVNLNAVLTFGKLW